MEHLSARPVSFISALMSHMCSKGTSDNLPISIQPLPQVDTTLMQERVKVAFLKWSWQEYHYKNQEIEESTNSCLLLQFTGFLHLKDP